MSKRILVVEDDQHINEVVCEYVSSAGHCALPVYTGTDAKEVIESEEPSLKIDLFILDIMLPGLSGLDLLNLLRTVGQYRQTPVIMLTALSDEYSQLLSFDGLADDYVTKPFSPKILIKRVDALFRRLGGAPMITPDGSIQIDAENYEAYEDGEKLPLTLREFELLKALAANRNKVVSRQQLLNQAWGYDYYGDDRIVDVHIKNLRKKITGNIISTVKGVGYKMTE